MRTRSSHTTLQLPALLAKAQQLAAELQQYTPTQLAAVMHTSPALADKTHQQFAAWSATANTATPAMDSFVGDIYSGLQASSFSEAERAYANDHLRILSGLYGILRPLDGIVPYRLEMGYRLLHEPFKNLYTFWGDTIARQLPTDEIIVNVAAVEYSKTISPYVSPDRIITPKFLTRDPKTNEPAFVVVHAKIARGAFAHWMIRHRIDDAAQLRTFSDIGYSYDTASSTPLEPVFICSDFGGKGLSMRLEK
jgi:cytoplasmic iron level regulating protein YaaA (DUF328/UPF0246 family)